MTLGELIERLEKHDKDTPIRMGISDGWGYYERVVFKLMPNTTVESMLKEAKKVIGEPNLYYEDSVINTDMDVYIEQEHWKDIAELSKVLLNFMLGVYG